MHPLYTGNVQEMRENYFDLKRNGYCNRIESAARVKLANQISGMTSGITHRYDVMNNSSGRTSGTIHGNDVRDHPLDVTLGTIHRKDRICYDVSGRQRQNFISMYCKTSAAAAKVTLRSTTTAGQDLFRPAFMNNIPAAAYSDNTAKVCIQET